MPNSPNERLTESIVRRKLDSCVAKTKARYWEQTPANERIRKCLRHASKSARAGKKKPGAGHPEFTVAFDEHQDFLAVFECKADIANHEGGINSAVGGALHYAGHLSRKYNTLAIAVSGTDISRLRVSHFWHFKGDAAPEPAFGGDLLTLGDYLAGYLDHPRVARQAMGDMLRFTQEMNDRLHTLQIPSPHRSLLVSAILMALQDRSFAKSYTEKKSASLLRDIKNTMLDEMQKAELQRDTFDAVAASYRFMDTPGELAKGRALIDLVADIDEQMHAFRKTHEYHDILGHLYVEFLRYSNSDKGLGIVLTPPHITQLAASLVQAGADDVIYDNCAGTGGFLVSGMKKMIESVKGDKTKEQRIKTRGLVGVEYQPDIAALLSSNMFIHGDGRSNIFRGDCFSKDIVGMVRDRYKPTIGMLNPPFRSSTGLRDEMAFALNNMDELAPGGRCVALMPMQCVLATRGKRLALKAQILENHTLEAVLSIPDELFHNSNVGVVTCMAIFTAHRPHPPNKKTWFARCKDDGYVIKKPLGRCDQMGRWEKIESMWVGRYHNRESVPGFSTACQVTAADEWCAEAHINTDYSKVPQTGIPVAIREYATFIAGREIARRLPAEENITLEEYAFSSRPAKGKDVLLPPVNEWRTYSVPDLFDVSGTQTTPLADLNAIGFGPYPYVTTQATNNGVADYFNRCTEDGGVITVDSAVLGFASYQPAPFSASDHVEKLTPQFPMNAYLAMFLVATLNANQFRFSYGRKASQTRLREMTLDLPALPDGKPDFAIMEEYVSTLPFSAAIG